MALIASRRLLLPLAIVAVVAYAAADPAAQRGSGQTTTQTAPRKLPKNLRPEQAAMRAYQCALTERHTASTGPGAPQIGLDPEWPQKYYGPWDEVKELYPDAAAPYESCVTMFRQANDIIKQISPKTRRPLWDVSGPEINAATKRASDLVRQGDQCLSEAQSGSKSQTDCLPPPDPQTQQQLRLDANEAIRTLAGCGQQCDIMLTTMGKLTAARLVQMTEPTEGILVRTARAAPDAIDNAMTATVSYLANDNAANHRMLLHQAQNAIAAANQQLRQSLRNPAASLGTVADAALWAKATSGAVGACEANVARLTALRNRITEARKAAQVAKEIEDRATSFGNGAQAPQCSSSGSGSWGNGNNTGGGQPSPPQRLPGTGTGAPGGPTSANPFNSNTNCVATSIAGAKREATGRPYTAIDVTLNQEIPSYGDVIKMLRENFGNQSFPELPIYQQKLQAAGVPRPMTKAAIESELRAAAQRGVQKPQGIVFTDGAQNGPTGHAFNAVWENGGVVYKDYQQGMLGQGGMYADSNFANVKDVAFYRVN